MSDEERCAKVAALLRLAERHEQQVRQDDFLRAADTARRVVEAVRAIAPWLRETGSENS